MDLLFMPNNNKTEKSRLARVTFALFLLLLLLGYVLYKSVRLTVRPMEQVSQGPKPRGTSDIWEKRAQGDPSEAAGRPTRLSRNLNTALIYSIHIRYYTFYNIYAEMTLQI